MTHTRFLAAICIAIACPPLFAAQRTFVSAATGSDANACSRLAPCRNFNAALLLTDSGGEVVALDSGGYGAASITQSVQVVAPVGVHAAITAFSGNAVTIDAPAAAVTLRGISLTGAGGTNGILVNNFGSLYLEHITATGFSTSGLNVSVAGHVAIENSHFARNSVGLAITAATGSINNVISEKNSSTGFATGGSAKIVITNSRAVGNGGHGYSCSGGSLTLESSVAAHQTNFNTAGLIASNGCTARLSNCTVINNYNALQNFGNSATVLLRVNNTVEDFTNLNVGNVGTYNAR